MALTRKAKVLIGLTVVLIVGTLGGIFCVGGIFAIVLGTVANSEAFAAFEEQVEGSNFEGTGLVTRTSISPWGSMSHHVSSHNGQRWGRAEFTAVLTGSHGSRRHRVKMFLQPDGEWVIESADPPLVPLIAVEEE